VKSFKGKNRQDFRILVFTYYLLRITRVQAYEISKTSMPNPLDTEDPFDLVHTIDHLVQMLEVCNVDGKNDDRPAIARGAHLGADDIRFAIGHRAADVGENPFLVF
jgi:hypothetical protein